MKGTLNLARFLFHFYRLKNESPSGEDKESQQSKHTENGSENAQKNTTMRQSGMHPQTTITCHSSLVTRHQENYLVKAYITIFTANLVLSTAIKRLFLK